MERIFRPCVGGKPARGARQVLTEKASTVQLCGKGISKVNSMMGVALQTCVAIAYALLLSGAAGAQSMKEMRAAYAEGRFVEAAELGAALKTSESYALAAQSLAMQGYFFAGQEEKKVLFQRGIELAEEAVRLDAANPEAHIQLAHTRGRYGQAIGFLQAVAGGYATKVRDSVEEALRLDPDMPGAHLSMATWHAEIVNDAGGMAGFLYGATAEKARRHYDRTIELMPDAKVACVEYAFGLLLMDGERNREEARRLLERAIEKSANDAVDRLYHELAVARLAALGDG